MFLCRKTYQHMTDADEGALKGWTLFWYRFHLSTCPHCRTGRKQLLQSLAVARALPAEEVPPAVEEAALAAFRQSRQKL